MGQPRRPADRKAAPVRLSGAATRPAPGAQARLLLSGFEPFGGSRRNPSLEVARALDGEAIGNLLVKALELPVLHGPATTRVVRAIRQLRPAAVLGLGQAGGRPVITLERVAINLLAQDGPDRRRRAPERPVLQPGPDAYFARLPLRQILGVLQTRNIPATLSLSAGAFICNAVMYAALHELRHRQAVPCGFIHLPYDTRQGLHNLTAPSMSLDLMIEGVRSAIAVIAELPALQ